MSDDRSTIATNRRARFDYDVIDTVEAGIMLTGSEVKSLRLGLVQLTDAYARVIDRAVWLDGVHIPPYQKAHGVGAHDPDRARKLLLHSREIERLGSQMARERLSLVPLSFYFVGGKVKVELGLARGRRRSDKRQALAERDSQREMQRALGRERKGM
jgi:SsrA-binding protein